jgi:hypothetical protein
MRRESLFPFLPAVLTALINAVAAAMVRPHQPDYPAIFIVFQVVMLGTALLAAVPNKWVRFVGFVILLAGVYISGMSVGMFLSSDLLCCRLGNDERRAATRAVRAGTMRTAASVGFIIAAALFAGSCSGTRHVTAKVQWSDGSGPNPRRPLSVGAVRFNFTGGNAN